METIIVSKAGILSGIAGYLTANILEALISIGIVLLGIVIKRYVIPLIKDADALQIAHRVAIIADDVTDHLKIKYPNKNWADWLDKAVDKIVEVLGVKPEVAERAAMAAIERKKKKA